ncbi:DUF1707 SHOCT-like domain-containing protein [Rhodococcus spongiicola]|uniref:DUF1707 domain-containing protein n=1 Tax=Rhodococcus spongiicola TaxID=2487352 RepID=A0A438B0Q8_9NOCA|nr:DUF1707 domain-containing protein [Rhodococcus spongiicola]RVW04544.1 DUF1707 domain-containing protein [Rhodococcus spongiicola]
MADVPDIRIGTAEREEALEALTQHFGDGRLTVAEFDERSGHIAAAATRGQLDKVFTDLPALSSAAESEPATGTSTPSETVNGRSWRNTVMAVLPFVALALFFLVPIDHSWLFFLLIPATAAVLFGGKGRSGKGHSGR